MARGQRVKAAAGAGRARREAPPRPGIAWGAWGPIVLTLVAALVYGNGLDAPLIFDDSALATNPYMTQVWPLTEAVRAPVQSSFAGRPVVSLSLAISYALGGGLTPSAFRLWNVAVLLASALVLFGIVRRTLRRRDLEAAAAATPASRPDVVALGVAVLWLVHPLHTEVVGYVTQRTESMMGLFYFLTLYAAIRVMERAGDARQWTAIAIAAAALGMACKESMVTAPVMVLLYDVVFGARSLRVALSQRRALHVGLAATWLLLVALNVATPRFRSAGFTAGVSAWTYLLNQAVMIVTYLKLVVWPQPLLIDYGPTEPIAFATVAPYALVVVALLGATAFAWRRDRTLAFVGTWFFVTLAPSSSIVPIATEVGAERRMYLPLAAVIVLLLVGLRAAVQRWAPDGRLAQPRAAATACVLTIAIWGGLAASRLQAYRDPIGLWRQVLDVRPHGRAHYNLGVHLKEAGRTADALEHYRAALPGQPVAHYALGFEYGSAERFEEAVTELRSFIRARPDDALVPKASVLLGRALTRTGKPGEAEQAYRETLRMMPGNADARIELADLLLSTQRFAEAAPIYRDYLRVHPDNAGAHHNLAMTLLSMEKAEEALPEFEKAVALDPSDANLRLSLGQALASSGRLEDAVDHFRAGLRLTPAHPRMMSALALTLAAGGEVNEPLDLFRRARQLAPNDPAVQSDYETAVARWRGQHQ